MMATKLRGRPTLDQAAAEAEKSDRMLVQYLSTDISMTGLGKKYGISRESIRGRLKLARRRMWSRVKAEAKREAGR